MAKSTLEKLKDQLNLTAGSGDTVTNNTVNFNDTTRVLTSTITTDKGSFTDTTTIPAGSPATSGVTSIIAGDNITISPVNGKGDVRINATNSGGVGQPTNINSTDLDISQTGYNATVNLKEQSSTSSVSKNNGLLDVKVDNTTVAKNNTGQLTAIGGSGSGQPTSITSSSIQVSQVGYNAEIELKQQDFDNSISVDPSTGKIDVKVDGTTVQKDELGRLKAMPTQGRVSHTTTLRGTGTDDDPLTVNISSYPDNAIGREVDGSLFVPKVDTGLTSVKHDETLKGAGNNASNLGVNISEDDGNTLTTGSDGGLFTMAGGSGSGQPTNFDSPNNTINFTGEAGSYNKHADVRLSPQDNNMLSSLPDGLYVPGGSGGSTPTAIDSPDGSLRVSGQDYNKHIEVQLSSSADNAIELRDTGLFVPKGSGSGGAVSHDTSLTGDGTTTPLGVAISNEADNDLGEDTTGALYVKRQKFETADATIGVIDVGTKRQQLYVKLSSLADNILRPKNDGLYAKLRNFVSSKSTVEIMNGEETVNVDIKDPGASSSVVITEDGTLDVKVDNTTIVKSEAGILTAIGGDSSSGQPTDITSPSTTISVGGTGYNRTVDLNANLREKINNVTNPYGYGLESKDTNGNIGIKVHEKTPAHINSSGELVIDAIDREHYYYSPQLEYGQSIPSAITSFYDIETGLPIDDNQEIREGSLVADVERRLLVVTKSTTTTPKGGIAVSRGLVNVAGVVDLEMDTASYSNRAISILGDAMHPVLRVNIPQAKDGVNNALQLTADGLYVPSSDGGESTFTTIDSPQHTIDVTQSGAHASIDVGISTETDSRGSNQLIRKFDGLYVPPVAPSAPPAFKDITGAPADNDALANSLSNKVNVADNHDIPAGGTTGKVLKKVSANNYDVEWGDEEIVTDSSLTGTGHPESPLEVQLSDNANNILSVDGLKGLLVDGSKIANTTHLVSPSTSITINDQDKSNIQIDLNAQLREKLNNVTNPTGGGIKSTSSTGNIGLNIADKTALHLNTSGQLVNDAISREHYYYSTQLSSSASSIPSSINVFYDVETSQQVTDNQEIREGSLVADIERRILCVTRSTTTTPNGNIAISRPLSHVVGPIDIQADTSNHSNYGLTVGGDAYHPTLRLNIPSTVGGVANALSMNSEGLFVPHEDAGTGNPTNIASPQHTMVIGGSGFDKTIDVQKASGGSYDDNVLQITSSGIYVPPVAPAPAPTFASIQGQPGDNTNLATALGGKVNVNENHDIPTGGIAGQFLTKSSSTNWDANWTTLDRTVRVDNTTVIGNGDSETLKVKISSKAGNVLQPDGDAGLFVPQGESKATDITSSSLNVGGTSFDRNIELKATTVAQLDSIATKQNKLIAGDNITITGDTISATVPPAQAVTFSAITGQPTDNANLATALNNKQNTLVAGQNITITGTTISADLTGDIDCGTW